jgi:anti-sigma B factor antagonist
MPSSEIVINRIQGVVIVTFQTAAIREMAAIEAIGKDLYALVEEQAQRKIILDFRAVTLLSSQMLGVLVLLQKKAKQIKGRVVLCGLRPDLFKVFQITKLDKILEFAPDEGEGLRKLDVL